MNELYSFKGIVQIVAGSMIGILSIDFFFDRESINLERIVSMLMWSVVLVSVASLLMLVVKLIKRFFTQGDN